jgi:hypothetical protein
MAMERVSRDLAAWRGGTSGSVEVVLVRGSRVRGVWRITCDAACVGDYARSADALCIAVNLAVEIERSGHAADVVFDT